MDKKGQNLQLAISANAAITALLTNRDKDVAGRLKEASTTLGELIDNLEADILNLNKAKIDSAASSPIQMSTGLNSPLKAPPGFAHTATASQQEYMHTLLDMLERKEQAIEIMRTEHNKTLQSLIQSHEETIRHICQGREETFRLHIASWTDSK